jgi:hypothetical protein
MASIEIGVPPPGKFELNPKLLLKFAPSIVTLFNLPSLPPNEFPIPEIWRKTG